MQFYVRKQNRISTLSTYLIVRIKSIVPEVFILYVLYKILQIILLV